MDSSGPRWSEDVGQADWIAGRLSPWGRGDLAVTGVVPGGFESYARLPHPAGDYVTGDRRVRWAEVAAWSGRPLRRTAQWHSVALPPSARPGPPPFSVGPGEGTLDLDDAATLAGVLRARTSTPDDCWFCVWDGFGWQSAQRVVSYRPVPGEAPESVLPEPPPDPVPGAVRDGPRVRLPHRDYLLYRGSADAVTATADLAGAGQTANLWWPADHAWCVATEIDLQSTYVGGPAGLSAALCADDRLEALPARPDDPVSLVPEDWVAGWADHLASTLVASGEATLATSRGMLRAWLRRPSGSGSGWLHIETADGESRSAIRAPLAPGDPAELGRELAWHLVLAIVRLAN